MNVFLVGADSPSEEEAQKSLIEKLAAAEDGSILPLTPDEMQLYRSDNFQVLSLGEYSGPIKLEEKGYYVFTGNPMLSDIERINEHMFNCDVDIRFLAVRDDIEG